MKQLVLLLTIVLFTGLSQLVFGQQCGINYTYDNAGNRTKRSLCVQGSIVVNSENNNTVTHESIVSFANETEAIEIRNDMDNDRFNVFPNPTSGKLYIDGCSMENTNFYIYNINGSLLKKGILDKKEIDVTFFPNGKYLLIVKDNQTIIKSIFLLAK